MARGRLGMDRHFRLWPSSSRAWASSELLLFVRVTMAMASGQARRRGGTACTEREPPADIVKLQSSSILVQRRGNTDAMTMLAFMFV